VGIEFIDLYSYLPPLYEIEAPNLSLSSMVIASLEGRGDKGLSFVSNSLEVNTSPSLRNDCNKSTVMSKPPSQKSLGKPA